jgi:hypothetical protein
MDKEKHGQALCPYDPKHNSTAVFVGKFRNTISVSVRYGKLNCCVYDSVINCTIKVLGIISHMLSHIKY